MMFKKILNNFGLKKNKEILNQEKQKNKNLPGKIFKAFLIGFLALYIISFFLEGTGQINEVPLSETLEKIKNRQAEKITVSGEMVKIKLKDGNVLISQKEPGVSFTEILKNIDVDPSSVNLSVNNFNLGKSIFNFILTWGPIVLLGIIFLPLFRQIGKSQSSIFSFSKSRARLFRKNGKTTFANVAGLKEAKEELKEVVDFLKNPERYRKMGARTPKGVLLVGPSGTGKTLMARAVAGEAKVPFFHMAGSEFMELFVGVGSSRVRDLFQTARKAGKAIIFIDELDAIGAARGFGFAAGNSEKDQTLNQLLVEMDGLEPNETIVIIAATNRPDILDPALVRPGRFDRRITLTLPDLAEREQILKLHAKNKPFAKNVSWQRVAKRTVGFSGADLENMLNEAAILAARERKEKITVKEIEEAAIKIKLGPQKKRMITEEDKKISAYHEAGHAIVSLFVPKTDPVERISIVSRGLALGYTLIPPEKDRVHEDKTRLLSQISILMGGRAAEKLIFDEITSGASADIQNATLLARQMVIDFGMSDLGPIYLGPQVDITEWGRSFFQPQEVSEKMQAKIDAEIKKIIDFCLKRAEEILKKHRAKLDKVAQKLLEKETLERTEFEKLIK